MKYYLTGQAFFSGQEAAVHNYGDAVWEELCDIQPTAITFNIRNITDRIDVLKHLEEGVRRRYIRLIMHNVVAEYQTTKGGLKCPLKRIGTTGWMLI